MLNIVIPMAGRGSRFTKAGYTLPKPLIHVFDKTMIETVIENLTPSLPHRFIFICQSDHIEQYGLDKKLAKYAPNCIIIVLDHITEGAACTVLLAKDYINTADPLMIANCDQWIDANISDYLALHKQNLDGFIMTMKANDPKWSFVKFDDAGKITAVIEKEVVSDEATVGIYNFKHGQDFVAAAEKMIAQDLRVNGEFYVAPVYNEMIACGAKLGIYNIGSELNGMYGLGTPQDLEKFLELNLLAEPA